MKEEKFKAINFIRELIVYLDSLLDNFPKKDLELKNRIRSNSYDLLEISYEANLSNDKMERERLLSKAIAKVKILDFLINLCYDKQIINCKKYVRFGKSIDDITKYLVGWKKSL
ncbi:MAG: four helix bundle protein [Clostridia bacterium]